MGYESKLIVVDRCELEAPNGSTWVFADEIAIFDLDKMGYDNHDFYDAFKEEIDFKVFVDSRDEETDTDCYGDKIKSADWEALLAALKRIEAEDHYRRLPPVIAMLEAFYAARDEWHDLRVLHYGY